MKVFLLILLLVLIASLGLVVQTELQEQSTGQAVLLTGDYTDSAETLLAQEPLVTYNSVENDDGNRIRLQYPPSAAVNQFNDEILIEYSGFNNSLNNQITDGYQVLVIKHPGQDVQSFFAGVEAVIAAQPVVVNGIDGYTYLTPSEIGDGALEHVIFTLDDSLLVEAQYVVAGEAKGTYRDLVWAIVQSIEVIE